MSQTIYELLGHSWELISLNGNFGLGVIYLPYLLIEIELDDFDPVIITIILIQDVPLYNKPY